MPYRIEIEPFKIEKPEPWRMLMLLGLELLEIGMLALLVLMALIGLFS